MKRCDSTEDTRLRKLKNGKIQKYQNRNKRTTVEGRVPDRLEAAEGGKSGRDSRRGKTARGITKISKDKILSDSFSYSSSKCSEVVQEEAGTVDKVVDATDKVIGTANNVAGTANNVTATADIVAGTADNAAATVDNVVGTADKVSGTAKNVAGTADRVSGTADRVSGTANKVSGTANNASGTADIAVLDPAVQSSSPGTSNGVVGSQVDENDLDLVTLEVSCGENEAQLRLNDLRGGSRRSCVLHNGAWLTPNEFQAVSGRGNAKDWKRSIRHHGRPLKVLLEQGLMSAVPAFCLCSVCDSQGPEVLSNERKNTAHDNGVAAKPFKKNEASRTRTRTKISTSAKEEHSGIVKRQRRKSVSVVEISIRKRNFTRKSELSKGGGQNQYGRRARNSGKTTKTTKKRRTGAGSDLCGAKSAGVASKRNVHRRAVKSTRNERPKGKRGRGRRKGRKGKGKGIEKSGNAADDHFRSVYDGDDDSRTIIDCGDAFQPKGLSGQGLNPSVPLDDGREGVGAGSDDDDDENRMSRGISAAKPELIFREAFREIEASKKRRKRGCLSTDELLISDKKRSKIEDDFHKDTTISGKEQEEIDKETDNKKDSIAERSPRTDTNGFDEVEKSLDDLSSPLHGVEQEQEHGKTSEKEDLHRDVKNRDLKIQFCVHSRQAENREDDDDLATSRAETILVIPSFHNSEISQNASKCNDNAKEFHTKKPPESKSQSDKSRLQTVTRTPLDAGSSGRGRPRAAGRGRGRRTSSVTAAAAKMADSTTMAKRHETMTSDRVVDDTASDDVSGIRSDDAGRGFDGNTRKTRGRNLSRMRNSDSKCLKEITEESRFCEFPVMESFPGTLFPRRTITSSTPEEEAFPVGASGYLPGIRFRYGARAPDDAEPAEQSLSGSTTLGGFGRSRSPGGQPEPDVVDAKTAVRRSRRHRNGVVSSTTSGYPSAELMTSLYERQTMMTSPSSSPRDVCRVGDVIGVRPGIDLERQHSPLVTEVHYLRQNDSHWQGVQGVQDCMRRSAEGFSRRGSSTGTGVLCHPRFLNRFEFRRIMDFADGVPLPGPPILAPGGDTCAPAGDTCAPFVYDHWGALDLTIPKVRSD